MDSIDFDDVKATVLPYAVSETERIAPMSGTHGTGLPFAGGTAVLAAAQAAVAGVRSTDLPGPVPRGAPV